MGDGRTVQGVQPGWAVSAAKGGGAEGEGASNALEECSRTCAYKGLIQDQVQYKEAGRSWSGCSRRQVAEEMKRKQERRGLSGPEHATLPPLPLSARGLQGSSPTTSAPPCLSGLQQVTAAQCPTDPQVYDGSAEPAPSTWLLQSVLLSQFSLERIFPFTCFVPLTAFYLFEVALV